MLGSGQCTSTSRLDECKNKKIPNKKSNNFYSQIMPKNNYERLLSELKNKTTTNNISDNKKNNNFYSQIISKENYEKKKLLKELSELNTTTNNISDNNEESLKRLEKQLNNLNITNEEKTKILEELELELQLEELIEMNESQKGGLKINRSTFTKEQNVIYDLLYDYTAILLQLKKNNSKCNTNKINTSIEHINIIINSNINYIINDRTVNVIKNLNKIIINNERSKKDLTIMINQMIIVLVAIFHNLNNKSKTGGSMESIIKETKNAIRSTIKYDKRKNNNKTNVNNAMANNRLYDKIYENLK
jgi:hypothetical protein